MLDTKKKKKKKERKNTITYIFSSRFARTGRVYFYIVYSTIYRPGCFRTVRGRSEGSWQENRLLYSKYLTLQYILMRSRNRERNLAYVAWKGERGELEGEKAVSR